MTPVKLLLVDDSLFMRNSLKKILDVPQIQIIDTASNGKEAVEKNIALDPDLILLDIEMPVMNGLVALKKIMETNPVPVLMFSSLTQDGAQETIEALSLGALDFVPKQSAYFDVSLAKEDLIQKIVQLGSNKFLRANIKAKYARLAKTLETSKTDEDTQPQQHVVKTRPNYQTNRNRPNPNDVKLICIGISTGGPAALQEVIPLLSADLPVAVLVVQHMPPLFTESLAKRLDQSSQIKVCEATDGEIIKPGVVYIAKGGMQMTVTRKNTIALSDKPTNELFKPSVNVLLDSVVDVYQNKAIGIIMTGMGNDGKNGLTKLANAGGYVIAQEPETCVVAGMPRSVIEANIAHEIQPLNNMAGTIAAIFNVRR